MTNNETDSLHNYNYLVCVRCFTFNHTKYITEALNGFCMQETTFPYICTIVDDASTDGEQDVIRNYLQKNFALEDKSTVRDEETDDYKLLFAQHKTNKNCFFAVLYLKYNHYSNPAIKSRKFKYISEWHDNAKYSALCEGDDYWTDPMKLQKQVDFMETHPDYGMIYTGHRRYIQKESRFVEGHNESQDFNDLLFANKIATHTVMLRMSLWNDYYKEIEPIAKQRRWKMGDTPLWLYIMAHSKTHYLPDITGVYRKLDNSMCHFTSFTKGRDFWISHYDMSLFFAKRYNVPVRIQKKIALDEVEYLLGMAQSYNANLSFPFYKHLKENGVFTWQRYISCKMRSSRLGRKLYSALKS